jgi:hypothetical protein
MAICGIRCLFLLELFQSAFGQETDLNVILMQSTFMVKGSAPSGGSTVGTGFLLFRSFVAQPDEKSKAGKLVLITAAHVLEEISGDDAVIFLRSHQSGNEDRSVAPAHFKISKDKCRGCSSSPSRCSRMVIAG